MRDLGETRPYPCECGRLGKTADYGLPPHTPFKNAPTHVNIGKFVCPGTIVSLAVV